VGLRRPIGSDYRGRRYWALGGAAGAFRIYVEEAEGGPWGYYEGSALLELLQWLSGLEIDTESRLVSLLHHMQWPLRVEPGRALPRLPAAPVAVKAEGAVKVEGAEGAGADPAAAQQQVVPAEPQEEPDVIWPELVHGQLPAPDQLMSPAFMEAARADGYNGLVAPLLFGESGVAANTLFMSSSLGRVQEGVMSLLSLLPFWSLGQEEVNSLAGLMVDIQVGGGRQEQN
jgi:hypothetical protein